MFEEGRAENGMGRGEAEMRQYNLIIPFSFSVSQRRIGFPDFKLEGNMQRQATFVRFWGNKLAAAAQAREVL